MFWKILITKNVCPLGEFSNANCNKITLLINHTPECPQGCRCERTIAVNHYLGDHSNRGHVKITLNTAIMVIEACHCIHTFYHE